MNIFFDLDGTLIDSKIRLYHLFNDLTGNETLTFKEYWGLKKHRFSNKWIIENFKEFNHIYWEEFNHLWMLNIENEKYLKKDKLFNFTLDTLSFLKKNHNLFLVTARQSKIQLNNQLNSLGLISYFQETFVTEQKVSKIQLIQNSNIYLNQDDVLVGDTGEDIIVAKELDIRSFAVLTGFRDSSILKLYEPKKIIKNISHLKIYL